MTRRGRRAMMYFGTRPVGRTWPTGRHQPQEGCGKTHCDDTSTRRPGVGRQHCLRDQGVDDGGAGSPNNQGEGSVDARQQPGDRNQRCRNDEGHHP